ncbi:expressed unknown protein [Seminavis robusta]|uniref:Uncharacterized protein n=1 Tax=Seminavis robusta TaxID=568900 RepID=A0A9N8EPW9_9STRA|nr:expressed unknown protein [Seminavis robusta]|eukprot:Sro1519_g279260.1 n/a (835) ;mRNA; f:2498-5331
MMLDQRQILPILCCLILFLSPASGNIRFDPDADGNTLVCTSAAHSNVDDYFRPSQGQCDDPYQNSTRMDDPLLTIDTISPILLQNLAVAYAPVIFFHPLERYTMSSVDATFSLPGRGKIYQTTGGGEKLIQDRLNMTTLLRTSRDPLWAPKSSSFYFTLEEYIKEQYYAKPTEQFGDGFDETTGKSKAKIYYNVFDSGNGTWTFNYWLYYEFNGEANMGMVTTSEDVGTRFWGFLMKPYGVHEGDFEAVSVMVCPPASETAAFEELVPEPLAVQYRQHNWAQLTDCTQGECKFYKDTYHPVGFSALNSHATYPESANEIVYINVEIGFFYNLQSYVAVDRTMYKKEDGTYNYFMPTVDNVERLQKPEDLTLEATQLKSHFWQAFGGNWGSAKPISLEAEPPLCLAKDQLSFVACPTHDEDPIFDFVMQMMNVREPRAEVVSLLQDVTSKVVEAAAVASAGPKGPVTKYFYEEWTKPINAPLWNSQQNADPTTAGTEYCVGAFDVPNMTHIGIEAKTVNVVDHIYAMVCTVIILTILTFLIPILILIRQGRSHYKPIRMSQEGVPRPLTTFDHMVYMMGALVYTLFFVILVSAGVIFLHGSNQMIDMLEQFVHGIRWQSLREFVFMLGVAILAANTLLLVFMWLQAFEMKSLIRLRYLQLSGSQTSVDGRRQVSWDKKFVPWNPLTVDIVFKLCFALLFLSMMFAMICVLLGVAVVGFAAAFVQACNATLGSLNYLCIDLSFLGIQQVACGDDFRSFCNQWAQSDTKLILWSSFLVFLSHFYIIASTGYAAQQRRSIPALLALYPEPEKGEHTGGSKATMLEEHPGEMRNDEPPR